MEKRMERNRIKRKLSLRSRARIAAGFVIVLAFVLLAGGIRLSTRTTDVPVTKAALDALPLDDINKLMVVAHPDDETFWGGEHLAEESYLVVCLTCGRDPVRREEFEQAVRHAGSVPLILNYPDKVLGIRSRWTGYLDDIREDLSVLLDYRDWDAVVTHNPDGEYGHLHHRRTSSMVTAQTRKHEGMSLYYFGIYHTPRELEEMDMAGSLPERLGLELFEMKEQMVGFYSSQERIAGQFCHMFPFEDWYEADWIETK